MIPSVKEEVDPLSEAKSQIWFIETFAKPLFDLTSSGIPGQFSILFHTISFSSDLSPLQRPQNMRTTAPRISLRGKREFYRFPHVTRAQVQSRILTVTRFTNVIVPSLLPKLLRIMYLRSPWPSLLPSDLGLIKVIDHLSTTGHRSPYPRLLF